MHALLQNFDEHLKLNLQQIIAYLQGTESVETTSIAISRVEIFSEGFILQNTSRPHLRNCVFLNDSTVPSVIVAISLRRNPFPVPQTALCRESERPLRNPASRGLSLILGFVKGVNGKGREVSLHT